MYSSMCYNRYILVPKSQFPSLFSLPKRDRAGRRGFFLIITGINIALFLLLSNNFGYAGTINIDPIVMELSGKPGEVLKGNYKITNPNDYSMTVETELRKWGGFIQNEDIKTEDWLKLESSTIDLEPEETKELDYTIDIPEDVIGELMGMVYFKTDSAPGSNLRMSLGTSIYVVVEGTEKIDVVVEYVRINRFDPDKDSTYGYVRERKPFYWLQVGIENNGNVHVRPKVRSYIKDHRTKKVVHKIDFKYGAPVFGGKKSGFRGDLNIEKMEPGIYFLDTVVTFHNLDVKLKKRIKFSVGVDGIPKIVGKKAKEDIEPTPLTSTRLR